MERLGGGEWLDWLEWLEAAVPCSISDSVTNVAEAGFISEDSPAADVIIPTHQKYTNFSIGKWNLF